VISRLDYVNATLAGLPACLLNRLPSVLNAVARSIASLHRSEHMRCSRQFSLATSARVHQVQTGGKCLPSSSRHCTSVLDRPAAVRRWSADETSRPAVLVDLQSSRRPPVAACHCRRSFFCCCWPTTTLNSLPDDVHQSQHFVRNLKHIYFGNLTQTLFFSCVAIVVLEVTCT